MIMKVIKRVLLVTSMVLSLPASAAPMDDVFDLLDAGGGVRSGNDSDEGYYLTALGMASGSSETLAKEEARMEALRYLNEMVNGINVSGSSYASIEYISSSNDPGNDYFREAFRDVVETSFKGHLSAAKTIKQGKYGDQFFVAIAISENDVRKTGSLRSTGHSTGSQPLDATIAGPGNTSESIETKGLAPMKHGEQRAREMALQDAMRNAVQQVQGVMVQGKSGAFNEALSFAISTKTEGYVGSYEILDEDIARGNYYVIIMAEVNSGKLLNDVNFYLDILGEPVFALQSDDPSKGSWLTSELERLGFTLHDGSSKPTHTFSLRQSQRQVKNHNGKIGAETSLTVTLKDNLSGEVLFTIINDPLKSRIYVTPYDRAKQVSQVSAYKKLKKQLGPEVITSLARYAEKGRIYPIAIHNARRSDWQLFRHVLENGTSGTVESWDWTKNGKVMVLNFRYSGKLSTAMDEGLQQLYKTYRMEGKGRRPTALKITDSKAVFEIVNQ